MKTITKEQALVRLGFLYALARAQRSAEDVTDARRDLEQFICAPPEVPDNPPTPTGPTVVVSLNQVTGAIDITQYP